MCCICTQKNLWHHGGPAARCAGTDGEGKSTDLRDRVEATEQLAVLRTQPGLWISSWLGPSGRHLPQSSATLLAGMTLQSMETDRQSSVFPGCICGNSSSLPVARGGVHSTSAATVKRCPDCSIDPGGDS